jgi:hypothetical protein
MHKMALGQVFLGVLRFSIVTIIPPMLHTFHPFKVTLSEGQTGEAWEPLKAMLFGISGSI